MRSWNTYVDVVVGSTNNPPLHTPRQRQASKHDRIACAPIGHPPILYFLWSYRREGQVHVTRALGFPNPSLPALARPTSQCASCSLVNSHGVHFPRSHTDRQTFACVWLCRNRSQRAGLWQSVCIEGGGRFWFLKVQSRLHSTGRAGNIFWRCTEWQTGNAGIVLIRELEASTHRAFEAACCIPEVQWPSATGHGRWWSLYMFLSPAHRVRTIAHAKGAPIRWFCCFDLSRAATIAIATEGGVWFWAKVWHFHIKRLDVNYED